MNMSDGEHLPPRLAAVARLIGDGKNNHEIGDVLGIEPHTSEKYVSELKRLLGARDRVHLVLMCRELGSGLP